MARATTPTHFHSSRLIRVLADLAMLDTAPPGAAFAERLGLWVAFTDAIRLHAVHSASTPATQPRTAGAAPGPAQAFAQLRTELEDAIRRGAATLPDSSDYEPWRRHYVAQQRDMEQKLGPLRATLREALDQSTPALRQLAALDAAFDTILVEREARLLSSLPLLLKRRFAHLQQAQRTPEGPDPALHPQPGAWLAGFGQELQTVLLAELDLRLQPALGLLEAFENEQAQQQTQHA